MVAHTSWQQVWCAGRASIAGQSGTACRQCRWWCRSCKSWQRSCRRLLLTCVARPGSACRHAAAGRRTGHAVLSMLEFHNKQQERLGVELPLTLVLDYPTLNGMVKYLGSTSCGGSKASSLKLTASLGLYQQLAWPCALWARRAAYLAVWPLVLVHGAMRM